MNVSNTVKRQVKKVLARTGVVNPFTKIFSDVEFETTAYCNRKCSYCPVSMYPRPGDENGRYMRQEVFEKIIQDLKNINYEGKIAPHLYGEPLTDPRIVEWTGYIRQELPNAEIKMVTNGDYLNEKIYRDLMDAGLNYFNLSKHSKDLAKPCLELLESLSPEEKESNFNILDFWHDWNNEQEMLNTRAGEVGLKVKKKNPIMCSYVVYPVINTFGDIILCCNDYHSEHKFGNVMDRPLDEIWFDEANVEKRLKIFKGIFDHKICQDCKM
jgi:cyclic pyranopterin phosphate synthase